MRCTKGSTRKEKKISQMLERNFKLRDSGDSSVKNVWNGTQKLIKLPESNGHWIAISYAIEVGN